MDFQTRKHDPLKIAQKNLHGKKNLSQFVLNTSILREPPLLLKLQRNQSQKDMFKEIVSTQSIHKNNSHKDLIRPFIDLNKIETSQFLQKTPQLNKNRVNSLTHDDEKLLMRSYWRQLNKWSAFEDYQYLRDPLDLKETRGIEILKYSIKILISNHDVVEPLNFSEGLQKAVIDTLFENRVQRIDGYRQFQRKSRLDEIQLSLESGNSNELKQNSGINAFEKDTPCIPRVKTRAINNKAKTLTLEVLPLIDKIHNSLMHHDIEIIALSTQKLVQIVWKIGIFNFFAIGTFIHCLILQMHTKNDQAFSNWKRFIKVCNFQGLKMHKYKLVAYKYMAKISLSNKSYDKVIVYLKKMLKLSWTMDDINFELLAYDLLALAYYQRQDLYRSKFFHEKFAAGDSEAKLSLIRYKQEQRYTLQQRKKDRLMEQSSDSEDSMDIDLLINDALRTKLERLQKQDLVQSLIKQTFKPIQEKGSKFSILKRMNYSILDNMSCHSVIGQYKSKKMTPLGPIDLSMSREVRSESIDCNLVKYLLNPKINKVLDSYLNSNISKTKEQSKLQYMESTIQLKMMLKVFAYDLKYQSAHQHLFQNGIEYIL